MPLTIVEIIIDCRICGDTIRTSVESEGTITCESCGTIYKYSNLDDNIRINKCDQRLFEEFSKAFDLIFSQGFVSHRGPTLDKDALLEAVTNGTKWFRFRSDREDIELDVSFLDSNQIIYHIFKSNIKFIKPINGNDFDFFTACKKYNDNVKALKKEVKDIKSFSGPQG